MDWAEFVADNIPSPKTISGEAYTGSGARGPVYAAAVDIMPCVVEYARRRVPVATADAAGAIVMATATVWGPPGMNLPPGSRVTLPDGRATKVLTMDTLDNHGHDIPSHVELMLE